MLNMNNGRRTFIKQSCTACMGFAGLSFLLQSCGVALPVVKTENVSNTLSVPLNKFDEKTFGLLPINYVNLLKCKDN